MKTLKTLICAIVLLSAHVVEAEDLVIQSFDPAGTMMFNEITNAAAYHVEGQFGEGWTHLVEYPPSGSGTVTATVSVVDPLMLFRVMAYIQEGEYLLVDLAGGASATNYPVSTRLGVPPGGWTEEHRTTMLVLRRIPAGTFTMGSPQEELGRFPGEVQHEVTLTQDFYAGVFEVTQEQWFRVMGNWPSYFTNDAYRASRPVERVSYEDIRGASSGAGWPGDALVDIGSFLGNLRQKTGLTSLDLPTEAQWEYACRAGTTTALNSGNNLSDIGSDPSMDEVGRYYYNGGSDYVQDGDTTVGTARVGSYLPNAWGLYDMHGGVWEWCLDWHDAYAGAEVDPAGAGSGTNRVYRGGSWSFNAQVCRSAFRFSYHPSFRNSGVGFRVTADVPGE